MKKIFCMILVLCLFSVSVFANINFTDLTDSHWAYSYVSQLVTDGTVKGYEDGSFRPANTVTRAEFVKMLGVGPERRNTDYADVPASHWGYEYIMTSGFETSGNNFYPGKNITRGETIELIWKRNGSKKGITAPKLILDQYKKNPDAVAWAYGYKVMVGDDGINLRLNDTLSRAEAATLIVRSREIDFTKAPSAFKDVVPESTMKMYFESFKLFDDGRLYSPDATVTNGEMSKAALRLAEDEFNFMYSSYNVKASFEHPYAKDVTVIADRCIKKGSASKEFADANANVENTLSAFSFAALQKTNSLISYGNINNTYSDISADIDSRKNVMLTFAYEKGIRMNSDGTIGALNNATHKDIAAFLIQFDHLIGMESAYSTAKNENGKYIVKDVKLRSNINSYPANKDDYACIIDGIDNYVYERPYPGSKPKESYNFSREYNDVFIAKLESLAEFINKNYGVEAELVMYPNLTWNNGKHFVLRLECNVKSVSKEISTKEAFSDSLITPVDEIIKPGAKYFIEITIENVNLFF
ncbi:MAG: S-layer homology domain-containing protein [Ruminococcaceae bacterium]|nr:S-layer homology domain-containing protein [Oscillospiraceae bacterium]